MIEMPKKKLNMQSSNGSSMLFVIISILALFVIGATVLFATSGSYILNRKFIKAESLYYNTDRVVQVVSKRLEQQVQLTLASLKVFDDTNTNVEPTIAQPLIFNRLVPLNVSLQPYASSQALSDAIMSKMNSLSDTEQKKISKGLYDIVFKLEIIDAIENGTNNILRPTTPISNFITNVLVKNLQTGVDDPQDVDLKPSGIDNFTIDDIKVDFDKTNYLQEDADWLASVLVAAGPTVPDYIDSISGKSLIQHYLNPKFTIQASDALYNLTKKIAATYQISSTAFTESDVDIASKSELAQTTTTLVNSKLSKLLTTAGDITINGSGAVNLNGDAYAYGTLPSNMNQNIIESTSFGGININNTTGVAQAVKITGNATTRGYFRATGTNQTINIIKDAARTDETGNLICDNLNTGEDSNNVDITIDNNVSTYNNIGMFRTDTDDVGSNNIYIKNSFYGLNQADGDKVNKSSSIVIDDTNSTLTIDGSMIIGSMVHLTNVTSSGGTVPYRMAESVAIGDNYKTYSYRVPIDITDDIENPMTQFYAMDETTWTINDGGTTENTSMLNPNTAVLADKDRYAYIYKYNILRNDPTSGDEIIYNNEYKKSQLILTQNAGNQYYAPGIVNANVNAVSNSFLISGDTTLNPWATSPDASSGFGTALPSIGGGAAIAILKGLDGNSGKKGEANTAVEFIKDYDEDAMYNVASPKDPSTFTRKEQEFTDDQGVLGLANPYIINAGINYVYLSRTADDLTLGNADLGGRTGIIYTKGSVTINATSDLTYHGVIIALGGITINTGGHTVTLTRDDAGFNFDTYYNQSGQTDIRKFFAPGNMPVIRESVDVYSNADRRTRLVDKIQVH
jgi:hypothetical protein